MACDKCKELGGQIAKMKKKMLKMQLKFESELEAKNKRIKEHEEQYRDSLTTHTNRLMHPFDNR